MRARTISFFSKAVLLALALPACGGKEATPAATTCDGALTTPKDACTWAYEFPADPSGCFGFGNGTGFSHGTTAQCESACGSSPNGEAADNCELYPGIVNGSNIWTLSCTVTTGPTCPRPPSCCNGGRRTEYFAALGFGPPRPGREVGSHFARTACMEASSVEAFRTLRDELIAHGAPRRLVRAARRAIRDEMRHVRQTSALSRRFGEEPVAPVLAPARPLRSLAAMALDNAVEGCVRETYAALECAWQARRAADPVVRSVMQRIARDELKHLSLSWEVHAWAMGRLDAATRAEVARAQEEGLRDILGELSSDPHPALVEVAGLPQSRSSSVLLAAIAERMAA